MTLGFQLSLLYELSARTRFGLNYRSDTDPDLSGKPSFTGLTDQRRQQLENAGIPDSEVPISAKLPQSVVSGLYHELSDRTAFTLDVAWFDFSEFQLTEIRLDNDKLDTQDQQFQDMWVVTAGVSRPITDQWTLKFGGLYLSEGVDDKDRSLALRLDRIWGLGVGAEYRWSKKYILGLNVVYYDLGEGPVDITIPIVGRLKGKFEDRDAIGLDLTFRWEFGTQEP